MNRLEKYYNTLACLIRTFYSLSIDTEALQATPISMQKDVNKLAMDFSNIDDESLNNINNYILQDNPEQSYLSFLIKKLDNYAYQQYEEQLELLSMDFSDTIQINGLNSDQNQIETGILLIPKSMCMWEGKSGQANHRNTVNEILKHSHAVTLKNGKVDGKYQIKNHILITSLYDIHLDSQNELATTVGLSPVTENISLTHDTYTQNMNGKIKNCFSVKAHDTETEKLLIDSIKKLLKKADALGSEVFVFPEMLGTGRMQEDVTAMLQTEPLKNIKFFVLPSVWKNNGKNAKNTNSSCILNYCGDLLFEQDKLKIFPFVDKITGERYNEDISVGSVIHIIHAHGYGSVAVLICRSELDTETRDMLIQQLNVKLLLCPSWTSGSSFEFKTSIMSGAEFCCNAVWCNTCSALRNNDKKNPKKEVGIITGYGKNPAFSELNFTGRIFPEESIDVKEEQAKLNKITDCVDKQNFNAALKTKLCNKRICKHQCECGCVFQEKIYGTDYCPDEEEVSYE